MELSFWHWLILGFALIALEVVVPGTFLVWPGMAAVVTGMVAYMAPGLPWQVMAGLFAVLTVVSAVVGRRIYGRLQHSVGDEPALNRRADAFVGTAHTLATPILDGQGRLKLGDSTWKIVGDDLPTGTRVRIVGVDGNALKVEKIEA
ncbi:MAG TPA: NfeD family protein [Magnetospirillum sp.]|nr:NfeD family protein [Magnetospirillum sp.]